MGNKTLAEIAAMYLECAKKYRRAGYNAQAVAMFRVYKDLIKVKR